MTQDIILPIVGVALLAFCLYAVTTTAPRIKDFNTPKQIVKAFGVEVQLSLLGFFVIIAAACLFSSITFRYLDLTKKIESLNEHLNDLATQLKEARESRPIDVPIRIHFDDATGLPVLQKLSCLASVQEDTSRSLVLKISQEGKGVLSTSLVSVLPSQHVSVSCNDVDHADHVWLAPHFWVSQLDINLTKTW